MHVPIKFSTHAICTHHAMIATEHIPMIQPEDQLDMTALCCDMVLWKG